MKIKSLLIGMLACTALVGCSDDDVLNNAEMGNQQAERKQAYLTFTVASATNSSRAEGGDNHGTTTGDGHGTADDSGHSNVGTTAENNISKIMIVFYNSDDETGDGFAKTYSLDANQTEITVDNDSKTYKPAEPYELTTLGKYKALVVLNPNSDIQNKATASIKTSAAAKEVYDFIMTGQASSTSKIIGEEKNYFMMTNKSEAIIEVKAQHDSPEEAAKPTGNNGVIDVERVVSKITFRPTELTTLKNGNQYKGSIDATNLYEIPYQKYKYDINQEDFWYWNGTTYTYLKNLNQATTDHAAAADRYNIWVYVDEEGNRTYYKETEEEYTGDIEGQTGVTKFKVELDEEFEGAPIYQGTSSKDGDELSYFIKLNKYTIVNKNNAVYYVRHTGTETSVNPTIYDETEKKYTYAFGAVSNTEYLLDPNTKSKSAASTVYENYHYNWGTPNGNKGTDWFGSTAINTVASAISSNTQQFTNLPGTYNDDNQYGTDGEMGSVSGTNNESPEDNNVGSVLDYCLENAVKKDNQNRLLNTGIIFEAEIYDNNYEKVKKMFHVNHNGKDLFYLNLRELVEKTGKENSPYYHFTDENFEAGTLTPATLEAAGITYYPEGKCYYFSSEIKHFANQSSVMEYAIMRNNIYSLKVDNVDGIGISSVDVESDILESGSELQKVYLTLTAKVTPWIVRFNNITF